MIKRLALSAQSILSFQPDFFDPNKKRSKLLHCQGYGHAREVLTLQNAVLWQDDSLVSQWPKPMMTNRRHRNSQHKRPKKRKAHHKNEN
jgi:hypothetical protein